MRKFIVNVNGTSYEVEVEEIGGASSGRPAAFVAPSPAAVRPAAPVAAPAPVAVPAPVAAAPAPAPVAAPAAAPAPVAASGNQTPVNAPMPGNILDVKVKVGDVVKADQVLVVLEAMKMENEIMSPAAGTVVAVNVAKGATVNSGDSLCIIG